MGVCDNPIKKDSRGKLTFELTTTALCDLDCTYCFEGAKTNPKKLQDLDLLIQRINEMLDFDWFNENYDGMSISFWGGEPTLNHNYIRKIVEAFKNDDRVHFHMYSNGYSIKNMKRVVDAMLDIKHKFEIQISYDGRAVNDIFRLTKGGLSTADNVLTTFEYLAEIGCNVFFKSTLPSSAMSKLSETWDNFKELHDKYNGKYESCHVSFAPTIDYAMTGGETKDENVQIFRNEILKIAKKEIDFHQEHGYHLMTWFGAGDEKVNCSAGLNMVSVDVDGSTYACHGALYSKKKSELKSSTIYSDDFINNIKQFNDRFESSVHNIPKECVDCEATQCIICPVEIHSKSEKETFFDQWEDRGINGLCAYYKAFGKIDRSVQVYLRNNRRK